MSDYVDIKGASGASYRFMRFRDGRPLSPAGGNFLYGRFTGARFELLYAGEVQNLLKDARSRWGEAQARYQASDLYTRLNLSERVRQLEHADIVQANDPPMNLEAGWPSPSPSDAFARRAAKVADADASRDLGAAASQHMPIPAPDPPSP